MASLAGTNSTWPTPSCIKPRMNLLGRATQLPEKCGKRTPIRTALNKQDAAEKLLTASQSAFDAVLDSYKQGLSTYPEVVSAERNLTAALATSHDTQSAIYTSQAALALSVGDLARPAPPLVRQPRR